MAEPTVIKTRKGVGCPPEDASLKSYFPSFTGKATCLKEYPASIDANLAQIFKDNQLDPIWVYQEVEGAVDAQMKVDGNVRDSYRFNKKVFYRYLVTTSVPWQPTSLNKSRDYWTIAGTAFLESLVVPLYHSLLL